MTFLISFGKFDKNIIYPILSGIFCFTANYILTQSKMAEFPIVLNMSSSIGMTLSFIFVIIYKHNNKRKSYFLIEHNSKNINKRKICNKFKYIIFCGLLDFLETFLINKFCLNCKLNLWIFDFLFLAIFSYFLFGTKIYIHHYLSIIFIILNGILLDLFLDHYNNLLINLSSNIIKFFVEIIR